MASDGVRRLSFGSKKDLCAASVWPAERRVFSKSSWEEGTLFFLFFFHSGEWGGLTRRELPLVGRSVSRPSRAIGLLYSCWLWLGRVISCQGQGSSLDPDLFPTGATGPATWDIPDDLGPHGQFARSIPSRWALTGRLISHRVIPRSRSSVRNGWNPQRNRSLGFRVHFCGSSRLSPAVSLVGDPWRFWVGIIYIINNEQCRPRE